MFIAGVDNWIKNDLASAWDTWQLNDNESVITHNKTLA